MRGNKPRVIFSYWGRRGLSRLALDVAQAALADTRISAHMSVSRQNEAYGDFAALGPALIPIDTFDGNIGALTSAWRIALIRRQLAQQLRAEPVDAVIELMPHVWSSFIAPVFRKGGARYASIIHDALPHPGDYRSRSIAWLAGRTLHQADRLITLSDAVTQQLVQAGTAPAKICTLFHPDLDFGVRRTLSPPLAGMPLRLAFFGRIMPYKGLPLFVSMIERLRQSGVTVEAGVFGEGDLGGEAARLQALGAEVINRWLSEADIAAALSRYHALVLSHVEASQSGVAAAAFGAGMPVIATPVGGLREQVVDGVNGVLAAHADAEALALAAGRLIDEAGLYERICAQLGRSRDAHSVERFVARVVACALSRPA